MLSIIIQEHNESKAFVRKMLEQTGQLSMDKELIFVTSKPYQQFYDEYLKGYTYRFPVSVIGRIDSCGAARTVGGEKAAGDTLLYMDCHVCFTPSALERLLKTLDRHENALVAPAIAPVEFPECRKSGAMGYGVVFRFVDRPFEWVWLSKQKDREYVVPFVCGCAFAMKKDTFNVLNAYGGFLGIHTGLSWEEEKSMRLWRLGHPTYIEPRAVFGHLFKGYAGHPQWDEHSTAGYYDSRVAGIYINVFDKVLWDHIESLCTRVWGQDVWNRYLRKAIRNYSWLREQLRPLKDRIREEWFLRTR